MTTPIFDRVDVMKVLKGSCLGPTGTSAVIIGANKVGKTHLLDHVYRSAERPHDTLFCRLDVDLLIARLRPDESLSDDTFVRHFLDSLADQIDEWVRHQGIEEHAWVRALKVAESEANLPEAKRDREKLAALEISRRALEAQLRELESLRSIRRAIHALLDEKERLTPFKLLAPMNQLHRLQKRILVIIDEFHRLLEEPGFSLNLWGFLRGANSEGKLVALLTSTTSLMDLSLHQGPGQSQDRRAYFNQYQAQPLVPFSISEASEFLGWLATQQGVELTDDETEYLSSLGGGSPYFLKKSFELFTLHGRPPRAQRAEFERLHLVPVLEPGFHDLWRRCSAEEMALLRALAAGTAVRVLEDSDRLEREGYVIRRDGRCQVFSALFAKFVMGQGEGLGNAVQATPRIGVRTIPTSLFVQQPHLAEPLVTFEINNPTADQVRVLLACSVPKFSLEKRDTIVIPPRRKETVTLSAVFNKGEIARLADPENAEVACQAKLLGPGNERILFDTTKPVQLLAKDHFVFARPDPAKGGHRHWAWLIAAWVTPNNGAITQALTALRAKHELVGYPPESGHVTSDVDVAALVRSQVEALYESLREMPIRYDNSATIFHQEEHDFAQRVRLPAKSLSDAAANCLDGCVLFATLLAGIGLHPVILFVRGHAVPGWKTNASDDAPLEFVDTTCLDRAGFRDAHAEGWNTYAKVRDLADEWRATEKTTIDTSRSFAVLVDINHELRRRKIIPLE